MFWLRAVVDSLEFYAGLTPLRHLYLIRELLFDRFELFKRVFARLFRQRFHLLYLYLFEVAFVQGGTLTGCLGSVAIEVRSCSKVDLRWERDQLLCRCVV